MMCAPPGRFEVGRQRGNGADRANGKTQRSRGTQEQQRRFEWFSRLFLRYSVSLCSTVASVFSVFWNSEVFGLADAVIDGITTRYEVVGSGAPLLMFSPGGFDATLEKWTTLGVYARIKALDHLSRK